MDNCILCRSRQFRRGSSTFRPVQDDGKGPSQDRKRECTMSVTFQSRALACPCPLDGLNFNFLCYWHDKGYAAGYVQAALDAHKRMGLTVPHWPAKSRQWAIWWRFKAGEDQKKASDIKDYNRLSDPSLVLLVCLCCGISVSSTISIKGQRRFRKRGT